MRTKSKRLRRGAAVVEMAICLPILMLFILGIVEFGRAYTAEHLLSNAGRMGARMSIVDGSTNSAVETKIQDFIVGTLSVEADDVLVTFDTTGTGGSDISKAITGDMCTVNVSISFADVSLLAGGHLDHLWLDAECTMEHE